MLCGIPAYPGGSHSCGERNAVFGRQLFGRKTFCRNRLPVRYNPNAGETVQWKAFLSQLLQEEDILTLQEFFGYCLIPSTKGQKMLLLTGKGGEGKSRVGVVLQALLGCNLKTGSIAKVEISPFARADLQNMLVMLDDDMKLEALTQTNNIKAIVTAELPMDLEKKGQQSYQADMRVRFLALGNGRMQALHDREAMASSADKFYWRQRSSRRIGGTIPILPGGYAPKRKESSSGPLRDCKGWWQTTSTLL